LAFTTALGLLALTGSPAGAITNGQLDGNRHPNVGCVVGQRPDGAFVGCGTGQLISPTVVLVAAHEFPVLQSLGATRFFVSFDSAVDLAATTFIEATSMVSAPSFNPISFSGEDLAVMLLAAPVVGVTPVQLPTAGLLDQMKTAGTLSTQRFVVVGYGNDCSDGIPCPVALDTTRRFATERFLSLQPKTLEVLSNNAATGGGGLCFGDSGGPHFLGDSNVSVGVTHLPLAQCNEAASATRIDTPSARSFLGQFVTLP
jgi:hypothetical protein